ncbi:hypothetical protein B0H14DRAFT_3156111 [Mycena olivaceomarginata]|nr:hypothetical protein B0H14DRAFT_3156111 [Mycena olivaceomarginata]
MTCGKSLPLPTRPASQSKIFAARSMPGSPLLLRVNCVHWQPPTAFRTVLSGTADFPGDDTSIPDRYLDYWTIGIPGGLVWTYNSSTGPEVRLFALTFETLLILPTPGSLRPLTPLVNAGQYWMFAAQGSLPFLPRDLNLNDTRNAFPQSPPRLLFLTHYQI